ncbi:MAG TPA: ParB N-terminal domain-containing protein [Anaerolineales bacterium]|nr:ParB N-terminal domain-containing protein [Anaerolineales bacterium]HLB73772.1 ParB N-terminal domain-containing protein [Sedimentisphaerales bacterium]
MASKEPVLSTLTLKGDEIAVETCLMNQEELRFFPENPRIYSFVNAGEEDEPSQSAIQERLAELDHVKQLVQSIKANGGLLDPLIVRAGDNIVLEGNSRLAAYRLLCQGNAIKWGKVKCTLLPEDISEDHVFALLGEYHIIGRKDWAPYEQAGYLWRRNKKHNVNTDQMAKEMGMSEPKIIHLIRVYDFMLNHSENSPQRWSYYDEYLKSRKIAHAREHLSDLDTVVVQKIQNGEIPKAANIRDKLSKICGLKGKDKGKILKNFVNNSWSLDECHERAISGGMNNAFYQRLNKFRTQICDPDTKSLIKKMTKSHRDKCVYELKHIRKRVADLLKMLEEKQ